jgi:hypothetical protein
MASPVDAWMNQMSIRTKAVLMIGLLLAAVVTLGVRDLVTGSGGGAAWVWGLVAVLVASALFMAWAAFSSLSRKCLL